MRASPLRRTLLVALVAFASALLWSGGAGVQRVAGGGNPAAPTDAGPTADWSSTLTADERAWLAAHKTVRVAFDGHFPPYSFLNDAGKLEGFAVDMLDELARRTGLTIEVSPETTWKGLYAAALSGQTDVVATMVERPDRRQWFGFTKPYITKSLVIMTRGNDDRIRSKQNLAGKTIAVVKDYQYVTPLSAHFPSATLQEHDTMVEALNAVSTRRADAAVTFLGAGHYVQTKYQMANLKFAAVYDQDSSFESIAVRKDWPALRSILDKALASISASERLALERKWLPGAPQPSPQTQLRLTEAEQAWIKAHPVIRLGVDPEFRPFEFVDASGRYRGSAADYVQLLNDRLGLNMVVVSGLTWKEATTGAEKGDIDVLPCVGITKERTSYLDYSSPYLEFQRVIITRTDTPFLRGLADLEGMRVAVQESSSHAGFLREKSTIQARAYPTLQRTVRAVSEGEADALVGNVASAAYWIRRLNLTNLKVAASASDQIHTLHFAVRKDWPVLTGLLEKGLASITDAEKQAISKRWLALQFDPKVEQRLPLRIVLGAAALLALFFVWNLQIRRGRRRLRVARDAAVAAGERAEAANAELEAMQEELEDLVRTRTAELVASEKMFHQAQKMEAMGTLVGGIAHDFNNILSGMLGTIYLAQKRLHDPVVANEKLDVANSLGFRGAEMIKQLLAYARKDTGDEKSQVGVDPFIADEVEVVRASIPSNIDVVVKTDAEGLSVHGNPALLEQVLLNLVNNARDALIDTEDPRIALRVGRFEATEEFTRNNPNLTGTEFVRFEVEDNGHGIGSDALKRVFDPFYTTKAPGKGTGLGLSMAYGAVRDHGGVITASSAEGGGSTFSVYLPLARDAHATDGTDDEHVHRGAGQTVLLADDDTPVREAHKEILTDLGYHVLVAADGAEAVELVREAGANIQLAILDVVMPKVDGVSAARQMRQLQPRLQVMFLSAHDFARDLPEHLRRSNETLLRKPCTVPLLSKTVMSKLRAAEDLSD